MLSWSGHQSRFVKLACTTGHLPALLSSAFASMCLSARVLAFPIRARSFALLGRAGGINGYVYGVEYRAQLRSTVVGPSSPPPGPCRGQAAAREARRSLWRAIRIRA